MHPIPPGSARAWVSPAWAVLLVAMGIVDGLAAAPAVQPLTREVRVKSPDTADVAFELGPVAATEQVRLALRARVDWTDLAGFNPWLVVRVNGQALEGSALLNKPLEFATRNGVEFAWAKGTSWTILYSPDFSDTIRTRIMPWGFPDTDPYTFVWDITRGVRPGANKLSFTHLPLLAQGTTLVLQDLELQVGEPIQSQGGEVVRPAPEGPLPTFVARGAQAVEMAAELSPGGALRLTVAGRRLALSTRSSAPAGAWHTTTAESWQPLAVGRSGRAAWTGTGYQVERTVSVRADHIQVADTFRNTTDQIVGVIVENSLDLAGQEPSETWLGGRPPCASEGVDEPAHPSAIARWPDLIVGLFAEDDIFRIHVRCFQQPGRLGLADPRLGLPPGQSHTLEWSLYPVPAGDYWDVINAVRRNWGSNITIPGPGLFDANTDGSKSLEYYQDMVRSRQLRLACSGQTAFKDGLLAEGTAIPLAREWCESAAAWVGKLHAADPQVKALVYVHPAISTEPDAATRYAECRLLDANRTHVTSPYSYPVYEYLACLDNAYGKAYAAAIDRILEEIKPDGLYMDEIARGSIPQYAYYTTWDGCSLDIDQNTHAVARQCSSTVLLSQPWKTALIERLRARGKMLIGNSPATTRTMLGWQVPLFTEMGSYSFVTDVHLCTPWALGNHDNENNDRVRSRMVRRALDYGGVICGYSWGDRPEGRHYLSLMFPLTPVELRAGMILGVERIVTNRSGSYGWPDGKEGDVYIVDGEGRLVPSPSALAQVTEAAPWKVTVRLPSDHFAIIVRRP